MSLTYFRVGKRLAIILLFTLLAAIAVMGYIFLQSGKTLFTDPYKAITPEACFVIETVDLKSLMNSITSGQGLFGELGNVKELSSFNRKVKFLADQLNKPDYKQILNEGTVLISFHPDKNQKLQLLLSAAVSGTMKKRHINELLHASGVREIIESNRGDINILKGVYKIDNRKDTVFISLISGLLLCSTAEELIKEADAAISTGRNIRSLNGFSRVFMASGKKEDKIFVVFKNLGPLLNSIFSEKGRYVAEKILKLADVAAGDIYISEGGLILNGYTESIEPAQLLNRYKSVSPEDFKTYKILPSATYMFETTIRPSGAVTGGSGIRTGNMGSFCNKIKSYLGDEISRVYLDLRGRPVSDNSLIIYELSDRIQAEQMFIEESGSLFETLYFKPDDATRQPVYKIQMTGLSESVNPGFAPGADETFITFYDSFMITGSSYETISRLLYDNLLNKTLANDLLYRDFESSLPSRSGYYFYCVPSRTTDFLAGFLKGDLVNALRSNRSSLNKLQAVGYQLASSNGMIYNSISVSFRKQEREESTTEWETLLDTVAAIKPFFFTNHTTGAKEIFIQDMNNNTYLINSAGRVLWKVPVREKITGTVYMIDYYRNGKYQLLFSGENYIHVLDRNGNYVERYPVRLRSPSTNSLALFDYDINKNYRLFIAGEDKLIYSYDINGSAVKGWKPFRTAGIVSTEICYFRISGKDYLVASDESSVYFLDRTGNKRLNIKEPVTRAKGSAMRLNAGSDPSVVCSSPDGTVQHIYFDGSVKKIRMRSFSVDHSFDFFDVDGDGFGEYLFLEKGIMYLYDHERSEIFTRNFETDAAGGPISFIFSSSDRKIGVFDSNRKLIYLIEKNGNTAKGFPLRGASMFSIGKLSDKSGWHLIVGGTDRFLYNYKIETD
jgi:WD40 repeat protein